MITRVMCFLALSLFVAEWSYSQRSIEIPVQPAGNGDGGPAVLARLSYPSGLAVDAAGNVYFAEPDTSRVRKVTTGGIIDTLAGGTLGNGGDGGPATTAGLSNPEGVAVDKAGNVYIADMSNSRIRIVTPDGIIRTLAAPTNPYGVVVDSRGNLYATLLGSRIVKVANGTSNGVPENGQPPGGRAPRGLPDYPSVAGSITRGYEGDGGPATSALLSPDPPAPGAVAVDAAGNLYIADSGNQRIRRVNAEGIITTFAGNGTRGFSGDGGMASAAQLNQPRSVAVDAAGSVYIGDGRNYRIRVVTRDGIIRTIAGNGASTLKGDGGPATAAGLDPVGLAFDAAGNLFIADRVNGRIRKIDRNGVINTVAGSVKPPGVLGGTIVAPPGVRGAR